MMLYHIPLVDDDIRKVITSLIVSYIQPNIKYDK